MIPIKIQCGCGQHYAFNAEPVNGRMSSTVACPGCGADGTATANEFVTRVLAAQPAVASLGGMRIQSAAPSLSASPSPFQTTRPSNVVSSVGNSKTRSAISSHPGRGRDFWGINEIQFNKLGNYIVICPAAMAAVISAGMFGFQVPFLVLCIVVGICGVGGGIMHVMGRGPISAGAFAGLVMGLGGYAAVYWWIQEHQNITRLQSVIVFVLGITPGLLLQFILLKILRKRANT